MNVREALTASYQTEDESWRLVAMSSDGGIIPTGIPDGMLDAIVAAVGNQELAGIDGCIAIVEQSLDTVRGEDDGESRVIRTSINAREHVLELLRSYRGRVAG